MAAHYPVHAARLRGAAMLGRHAPPLLSAARASAARARAALRALGTLFTPDEEPACGEDDAPRPFAAEVRAALRKWLGGVGDGEGEAEALGVLLGEGGWADEGGGEEGGADEGGAVWGVVVGVARVWLWPIFAARYVVGVVAAWRRAALERAALLLRMERARSYGEWRRAALALDRADGADVWKAGGSAGGAGVCDVHVVERRLGELSRAYRAGNVGALAELLRGALERNYAGMCHPDMHACAAVGTKDVVEEYVNVVSYLLLYVAVRSGGERLRFFNEARHAYGRTALLLSGGAVMGLNHLGVVKALLEHGLLPRVVSGTSAGAIVAAMVAQYTDGELTAILRSAGLENPRTGEPFGFGYFDETMTPWARVVHLATKGCMQDAGSVERALRASLGDVTFGEAYLRTRRIVNISVCPAGGARGPPLLLNYLTAPDVVIWSAAAASCALPLVFSPVQLRAKGPDGAPVPYLAKGARFIDGSVTSDVPLARIGEMFNVNHFIVSQTNPHVIPRALPLFQTRLALLIKSELQFRYWQALQLRLIPRLLSSLLPHMLQPYEGDITIMPETTLADLSGLLRNPTLPVVRRFIARGERHTFPQLDRVRLQCLVERALDQCVDTAARAARAHPAHKPARPPARVHPPAIGRVPSWLWVDSAATDSPPPERTLSL